MRLNHDVSCRVPALARSRRAKLAIAILNKRDADAAKVEASAKPDALPKPNGGSGKALRR